MESNTEHVPSSRCHISICVLVQIPDRRPVGAKHLVRMDPVVRFVCVVAERSPEHLILFKCNANSN